MFALWYDAIFCVCDTTPFHYEMDANTYILVPWIYEYDYSLTQSMNIIRTYGCHSAPIIIVGTRSQRKILAGTVALVT